MKKKEKELKVVIANPEAIEGAKKKFTEYVLKAYEMKCLQDMNKDKQQADQINCGK